MGQFATGVAVVSSHDALGAPVGTTVNALSCLSLEPPLVLVCLARTSQTLEAIRLDGAFALTILSAEQRHLADHFARPASRATPRIDDALAVVECEVEDILPGGDHEIVLGAVRELSAGDGRPLLFYGGRYHELAESAEPRYECTLPTSFGDASLQASDPYPDGTMVLTLSFGGAGPVYAHVGCTLGDVFRSGLCDCGDTLSATLEQLGATGAGRLIYVKRPFVGDLPCRSEADVTAPRVAAAIRRLGSTGGKPVRVGEPELAERLRALGVPATHVRVAAQRSAA
jgi:flavin reductase (DIM6/NTAB) family NADH-FMN oxidoreductase RutF